MTTTTTAADEPERSSDWATLNVGSAHTEAGRRHETDPAPRPAPGYECMVGSPGFFLLNQACIAVRLAFDETPYLVGSAVHSKQYRDVDVRLILDDDRYAELFPGIVEVRNPRCHALWSLLCSSISLHLAQASGLPIDFQIQPRGVANERFPGAARRIPLGLFPAPSS